MVPESSGAAVALEEAAQRPDERPDGNRRSALVLDNHPVGTEVSPPQTERMQQNSAEDHVERSDSTVGGHQVEDKPHKSALAHCPCPWPSRVHVRPCDPCDTPAMDQALAAEKRLVESA